MIWLLADLAASKALRDTTNVVLPGVKGAITHDKMLLGHDNGEKLWDNGGRERWYSTWRKCTG